MRTYRLLAAVAAAVGLLTGCAGNGIPVSELSPADSVSATTEYHIGPGDVLDIFVWMNDDLSVTVPVRPDGRVSTPLVEDMQAAGKTATELAADIELLLGEFIRTPEVSVIVQSFVGTFEEQIRVVGQAAQPRALAYRNGITLLDVMIEVGGLTEFAAGNRATIIRNGSNGREMEISVRLNDMLNKGDTSQNISMQPGDILMIPGSFF